MPDPQNPSLVNGVPIPPSLAPSNSSQGFNFGNLSLDPSSPQVQNAMQAMTQGQDQGQGQEAPTFSAQTNQLAYPEVDLGPLNDAKEKVLTSNKQLQDLLTDPKRQALYDQSLKTIATSPEEIAQRLTQQQFGKTTDATGKTHTNYLQMLLGGVNEAFRILHTLPTGRYQIPYLRNLGFATSQYSKEAAPAIKELYNEAYDRRTLEQGASKYQAEYDKMAAATERTQLGVVNAKIKTYEANANVYSKLQQLDPTITLKKAQADALAGKPGELKAQTDYYNSLANAYNKTLGLKGPEGLITASEKGGVSGNAVPLDIAAHLGMNPGTVNPIGGNMGVGTKTNQIIPLGQGRPDIPQIGVGANGNATLPSSIPQTTKSNGVPVSGPALKEGRAIPNMGNYNPKTDGANEWTSPSQQWPLQARSNGGQGVAQLQKTPQSRNWQNDSTLYVPPPEGKLDDYDKRLIASSNSLSSAYHEMYSLLNGPNKISDKELGALAGNWNAIMEGKVVTDPKLVQFSNMAQVLGLAHVTAQGTRSGNLIQHIAQSLRIYGTDRQSLNKALSAYASQVKSVADVLPQAKLGISRGLNTSGGDYWELERLVNPAQWKKDMMVLAKENGRKFDANQF